MTSLDVTRSEWVVYCPVHRHYLVHASAIGATWMGDADAARRYTEADADRGIERATLYDCKPTKWAVAARAPVDDADVAASAPVEALDLDAIEARATAATAGPWGTDWDSCGCEPGCGCGSWVRAITMPEPHGEPRRDDSGYADGQYDYTEVSEMTTATAEFIAAARTDVPALAAEVRRLRQIVDAVGKLCRDSEGGVVSLEVVEATMSEAGVRPADLDGGAAHGAAVALQRLAEYGQGFITYELENGEFTQGVDAMIREARRLAEAAMEGRSDG